jgi:alanine racemase
MELINHEYDIEKMAKECGTISNEILTSISNRVKRNYI